MSNLRLIARLDIKAPNLIKSINLEGIRVIGDPHKYALKYYQAGADEIIYMDMVASLYGRNSLKDLVKETTQDIFVPLTVGGGIRSVGDAEALLMSGADKIALNTAATQNPNLITELAKRFGSQCVVISIEAKKQDNAQWEAYVDCGRERSGLNVVEWARRAQNLGAGEILLTSIDREGTRDGFDIELTQAVQNVISIPLIASGGYGKPDHIQSIAQTGADALAFADALHYERETMHDIRAHALRYNLSVRDF